MGGLRYYLKQYKHMKGKVYEMNMNAMSDNAFWAIVVSVISVCLTTVILGLVASNIVRTKWYVGAGYTKTTLPGVREVVWVKEAK